MYKRTTVLLKINNIYYKFLSIFYSKKDPSYFFYNHIVDESGPLVIKELFHLLSDSGNFSTNTLKDKLVKDGDLVHISIHPKRIYVKKRAKGCAEEHLMAEIEPQPFNKAGFKLHCIFTPAPITHLPIYDLSKKKSKEELITFEWTSNQCPQISIYELENKINESIINSLPEGLEIKIINFDNIHPKIVLHLRATNGAPGIWRPNCNLFGKILKKDPILKDELQRIISYNNAKFDVSSLPDNAIISDYKVIE